MEMETNERLLGRIDERTMNIEKTLTDFIAAQAVKEKEQDDKIDVMWSWRSYILGGGAVLLVIAGWLTSLAAGIIHLPGH